MYLFCTNVRIWIDLGEKNGKKFVDFLLDNNILWNTQNAPDRTIFSAALAAVLISL